MRLILATKTDSAIWPFESLSRYPLFNSFYLDWAKPLKCITHRTDDDHLDFMAWS